MLKIIKTIRWADVFAGITLLVALFLLVKDQFEIALPLIIGILIAYGVYQKVNNNKLNKNQ